MARTRNRKTATTPEEIKKLRDRLILRLDGEGFSQIEIHRQIKNNSKYATVPRSRASIRRVLIDAGLTTQRGGCAEKKQRHAAMVQRIKKLHDQGLFGPEIAEKIGLGMVSIYRYLDGTDIKLRFKDRWGHCKLPDNFDEILRYWYTDEKMSLYAIIDKVRDKYDVKVSKDYLSGRMKAAGVAIRTDAERQKVVSSKPDYKNPYRIDLDEATESRIASLYREGYGTLRMQKEFGLDVSGGLLSRILREHGIKKRTRKGAARLRDHYVEVAEDVQREIVRAYEEGESRTSLAAKHDLGGSVVERVLREHNVDLRSPEETQKLIQHRQLQERRKAKLQKIGPRLEAEVDLIRNSIWALYRSKHKKKFRNMIPEDEIVDRTMTHTSRVAMRWKKPDMGDNFTWFVANYSLLSLIDEIRSETGYRLKHKPKHAPMSLSEPLAASGLGFFTVGDTIESNREAPPGEQMNWEDTKAKIIWEVRELIRTEQLRPEHLTLVQDYYFPIVDEGHPRKTMTQIGRQHGISAARISQLAGATPAGMLFQDMMKEVLLEQLVA